MAELIGKFNKGGVTSNTIDKQFSEEFVTKAVVEVPKRKSHFLVRADKFSMPKKSGDKLLREVSYGMLDKRVLIDGGVDANTATILQDVFYVVPTGSKDITSATAIFDTKDYFATGSYATWILARAAAKAAADADAGAGEEVVSGSGGMVNGEASYAATEGPLVEMPEEGGVINLLNHYSKMVSANITFHGIGHKFSMRSVNLDSRKGLIARKIQYMADAVQDLKEMQVRRDLIAAGSVNAIVCNASENPATDTISEIDGLDVLSYTGLETLEQYLLNNDVPMDTEILTGVDLVDTKTVSDAWIVYVNTEVLPTLRAMKGPGDTLVWVPKEQYAAGTDLVDGEQGKIGQFRFVTVKDMEREYGAGLEVGLAVDAGNGTDSANSATQSAAYQTNGKYDVFTALVVGDDSFTITGFGSNSTAASYIPPKKDVHNDMHAQMAGISANWSYGFLNYRPERIASLKFSVSKNPSVVAAA
jgi:N4-gp56 family major capsid protein